LIGPSGKVSSWSDFIEVEDVLLEDNEKLIFDGLWVSFEEENY
jgi:hypothetical protein